MNLCVLLRRLSCASIALLQSASGSWVIQWRLDLESNFIIVKNPEEKANSSLEKISLIGFQDHEMNKTLARVQFRTDLHPHVSLSF